MCARITISTSKEEIADLFGLGHDMSYPPQKPRYNVAPSLPIPVVRIANGVRELVELIWGLVPHWQNKPKPAGFPNARAETVLEKPTFRDPFRSRRCLVPVDGFFEWKTIGKKKYPYHFRPAGGGMFVFAGLWDRWEGPNETLETVTILTVPANELVAPLHDRMPAVLTAGQCDEWLNPKARPATLLALFAPHPVERMEKWPVSQRVNRVGEDGPELLERVPEPREPAPQPSLFD